MNAIMDPMRVDASSVEALEYQMPTTAKNVQSRRKIETDVPRSSTWDRPRRICSMSGKSMALRSVDGLEELSRGGCVVQGEPLLLVLVEVKVCWVGLVSSPGVGTLATKSGTETWPNAQFLVMTWALIKLGSWS